MMHAHTHLLSSLYTQFLNINFISVQPQKGHF